MTDDSISGAMTMVKIDGGKVKLLRENQGLTQLYLATAVQVTTDTISRWENRRYPSIKKENGLNLAEALGVELEELLESPAPDISSPFQADCKSTEFKKYWPLALLAATFTAILGGFGYYLMIATTPVPLTAKRSLPVHCIQGQPFPVIIAVTGVPPGSTALILKEEFPENATILKTLPGVNAAGLKNKGIKWLQKIEKSTLFSYVLTIDGRKNEALLFDGSVAINSNSSNSLPITGDIKISLGKHHWADSDGDNIISDNEILTVYDRYSEIEGLGLNIDLIEEIWLGSGYNWDQKTSSYEIFE
jgi:transcriptional regulator with XRE-family HTH domain